MTGPEASCAREIEARVLGFIRAYSLLSPGDIVVAGVSGGADSLCLLYVLQRLQEQLGVGVHVAHLNHMLRGDAARDEVEFVAGQAAAVGVPFTQEEIDVQAYARVNAMGIEEAARHVRYAFLHEVAETVGAGYVATGHTRDDSIETVIMNIIRGTGIHGLRGLDAASSVPVGPTILPENHSIRLIRPLLELSRCDTEAYCGAMRLEPRMDASNASPEFLRNRVRHQVLPLLRQVNPGFDDATLRLAVTAREDDDLLVRQSDALWARIAEVSQSHVCLQSDVFVDAPSPLQVRVVRRAFELLAGSARDLTMAHIRAIQSLSSGPGGKTIRVAHGIVWRKEGESLLAFVRGSDPTAAEAVMPAQPVPLSIPGESVIAGWRVTAEILDTVPAGVESDLEAVFDAERVGTDVSVRRRRPGDRMRPLGMSGSKKLQDLMVDCKVPAVARDGVPVVCAGEGIVWLVGCRVDDRFKVAPSTRSVLRLSFARASA